MQVEKVTDEVGTAQGHRGIQFVFQTTTEPVQVVFDFYGFGAQFNGATYARIEAAALRSVVSRGYEVKSYAHFLIA